MTPHRHFVSVVIPTSGRRTIEDVQQALMDQSRPPDDVLIILDRERKGPAWGRNRGIEKSQGDIIAFLDDDTIPPREWLARMIDALDTTGSDGVGGSFIESDPLLNEVRSLRPLPATQIVDGFGLVGNSGNLILRRRVTEALRSRDGHVFAEQFGIYGSEDWELVMRIRQAGYRLVYVPVHVRHLRRVTITSYLKHQFNRGIGIALLHKAVRDRGQGVLPQQSVLWDPERTGAERLLGLLMAKIVGPVNASSFTHKRYFLVHWIAEKVQSIGYLWGVLRYGR
jgi:O-antigen biosynthesis protein